MLEVRLKPSELSVFEKHIQNIYRRCLKKQVHRIINASYTTYFLSFEILHRFIKSFVIQTPYKVFGTLKSYILKSDLKYLQTDRLKTIRNQWNIRKVKDTKFIIFGNSCNLNKVAVNPV